jgi:hypothetical protein
MGILYELQIFRDQRWKVDSVFDDKELAIREARHMGENGPLAVRVIEERTDQKTGRAVLRSVFRISPMDRSGTINAESVDDVEQRVQTYVTDARRRKQPIGLLTIVLRLLLLAALVGAGFIAVYFVQDYLNTIMP